MSKDENRTLIDIHILQTVPPSNLNRDDTGSPKTAIYGGVRRSRVSSQAWKRAAREAFKSYLDESELGTRTKRVVDLLAEEIVDQAPELEERASELASSTFETIGIKLEKPKKDESQEEKEDATLQSQYLLFLSRRQIQNLASAATEAAGADDVKKALRAAKVKDLANRDHSVDIALFGRMVADQNDINVDAAAQVAHAISVDSVETEFDYYTAVDDRLDDDETGAGMIGTVEVNSATLYRYAAVDVNRLADNLGDALATRRAVEAFLQAFVRSMPSGKQNSFAHRTLPEAVVVVVRESQPINLVGAFEKPIRELERKGRVKRAAEELCNEAQEIERAYGEKPISSWVTRVGPDTDSLDELGANVPLDEMVTQLGELVETRRGEQS